MNKKKLVFSLSHPIQYYSPLFQYMNLENEIQLKVVYFTDHTIGGLDRQFGQKIHWDIPLLNGYESYFIKNLSPKPAVSGSFFGLINPSIFNFLRKERPDYLVVHGWGYVSNFLTLLSAKILGIPVLMRAESPHKQETGKSKMIFQFKRFLLKYFCKKFLYIGQSNKTFYREHGINEEQLFFTPYAVDNQRFREAYLHLRDQKEDLRSKHGIGPKETVFLFTGKYIHKKRPLDLIKAFHLLNSSNARLIMVGEGALRKEMEDYIREHQLQKVHLTGFVNQKEITEYYAIGDVFVLPSGAGETWGLVVNEAMNFDLPLIISDMVGCSEDLVHEGKNGFTFPCGNIDQLTEKMKVMLSPSVNLASMGKNSGEIVKRYSYSSILTGIKHAIS